MVESLSYIGFTSPNAEQWRTFGPQMLGLQAGDAPSGGVRLRLDEAPWRVCVAPGEANALAFVGWEVADAAALAALSETLAGRGIEVHAGDAALTADRAVQGLAWFYDPIGFRHELSYGREKAANPFASATGAKFVTADQGFGHIVLMVPDLEQATEFYMNVLGMRHSDDIEGGMMLRFFHCNPRHHSLAIAQVPGHRGLHHLMLQVESVDDVGQAYDRVNAAGLPLAMTLGRHTNDEMFSFYVRSPSGFEIEYGAGARVMDMQSQEPPGHYDAGSRWGHKGPAEPLPPGILEPVA